MAPQYRRPGGVNIGHQIVGILIAAVGMIALGQREICGREFPCRDRADIDPKPLKQCQCVLGKQLLALPEVVKVRCVEIW